MCLHGPEYPNYEAYPGFHHIWDTVRGTYDTFIMNTNQVIYRHSNRITTDTYHIQALLQ